MKSLSQESFASFVTSEAAVKSVLCEISCSKFQNFQTRQKTKILETNAKSAVLSNHQNFSVLISRPTNQSSFDSFEF
jgi:hypothetical protein